VPHPYSGTHQREKLKALAAMPEGQRCPLCGKPMFKKQALDYHHITPLKLGGAPDGPKQLAHRLRSCNRAQGPELAQIGRPATIHPPKPVEPKSKTDGNDPIMDSHHCITGQKAEISYWDCDACANASDPEPFDPRTCGHYEIYWDTCEDCRKFREAILVLSEPELSRWAISFPPAGPAGGFREAPHVESPGPLYWR
jgi:hypothetical protein